MSKKLRLCLSALLLMVVGGLMSDASRACVDRDPPPPPIWITFIGFDDITGEACYEVVFHNFFSFGAGMGQLCSCGLVSIPFRLVDPGCRVDSFFIRDLGTGQPVPGWSFAPSASGANEWAPLLNANPNDIAAFSSEVSQVIPPGLNLELVFIIKCPAFAPAEDFANALNGPFAGMPLLGTDEGTPSGGPLGTHTRAGPGGPAMAMGPSTIPTVGQWGLIILALTLATGATIALVRRPHPTLAA